MRFSSQLLELLVRLLRPSNKTSVTIRLAMNKISKIDVKRFMGVKDVSCYFRLGSKIKFQNVLFIVPRFGTWSFDVFKAEKDPSVCLKRCTVRDGVDCSLPWQYLVEKLRKMTNNRAISLTRAVCGLRLTSSQSISEKNWQPIKGVKATSSFIAFCAFTNLKCQQVSSRTRNITSY